jgi:hypothetical protein
MLAISPLHGYIALNILSLLPLVEHLAGRNKKVLENRQVLRFYSTDMYVPDVLNITMELFSDYTNTGLVLHVLVKTVD